MDIKSLNVEKELLNIFENVGVYFDGKEFYDLPLQLDSLQFVEVIIALEEKFFIRIINDFSEFEKLKTFRDFYNLVDICFYGEGLKNQV